MVETLPRELLIKVLLEADFNSILAMKRTNTQLQEIIEEEQFWPSKLSHSYPLYLGDLYYQSAKSTIKLLDQGKEIILQVQKNSQPPKPEIIEITPYTTILDIYRELTYLSSVSSMGWLEIILYNHRLFTTIQSSRKIPTLFYYDRFSENAESVSLNPNQSLYSIALPVDNQNLYIIIKKLIWQGTNIAHDHQN